MPRRVASFDLDINKTNMTTRFNCKDYEDILVNANILENGQPFDLTNCTVDFISTLGVNEIITVSDNVVSFTFNTENNQSGCVEAEIIISDEEGILKTPSFFFNITRSLSGLIVLTWYSLTDTEGYTLIDSENFYLKVRG